MSFVKFNTIDRYGEVTPMIIPEASIVSITLKDDSDLWWLKYKDPEKYGTRSAVINGDNLNKLLTIKEA